MNFFDTEAQVDSACIVKRFLNFVRFRHNFAKFLALDMKAEVYDMISAFFDNMTASSLASILASTTS